MNLLKSLRKLVREKPAPDPNRDPLIPPADLIEGVGGGGETVFVQVGRSFSIILSNSADCVPSDRVLDIGCGCGRMALPMIAFLQEPGEYWGFDIVRPAVEWAQRNISPRHPRFHFEASDVYNKGYNPKGKTLPGKYRFPYADNFFDFTFLTSVFTHMLAPEMRQYLSEIARTLKPGGKCFATYFVLNAESRALIAQGKSSSTFAHAMPDCAVNSTKTPEAAVAYDEAVIRQSMAERGLSTSEPFYFGHWSGRTPFVSYQDIVISVKRP